MGCAAGKTKIQVVNIHEASPSSVPCQRHASRTLRRATHFSVNTGEVYCSDCYGNLENRGDVYEIKPSTFDTKLMQLNNKAKTQSKHLQEEIQRIKRLKQTNTKAKEDFIEELGDSVDFLTTLKDELCDDIQTKADECNEKLETGRLGLQNILDETLSVQSDIKRSQSTPAGDAKKIQSIVEITNRLRTDQIDIKNAAANTDLELRLEYNTQLTLNDILHAKSDTNRIKLGDPTISRLPRELKIDDVGSSVQTESDATDSTINNWQRSYASTSRNEGTTAPSRNARSKLDSGFEEQISYRSTNELAEMGPVRSKRRGRVFPMTSSASPEYRLQSGISSGGSRIWSEARESAILPTIAEHKPLHLNRLNTIDPPRKGYYENVTDSVELEDGRVVLCDEWNGTLILLDANLSFVHRLKLEGNPHNATVVDGSTSTVAVTIPNRSMIQFIDIEDRELVDSGESLTTKPNCRGIEYINNQLMYTSERKVVVDNRFTIDFDFVNPVSLSADRENKILYVACNGLVASQGEVVIVDLSERHDDPYPVSHRNMVHPIYCTKSNGDFMYVCSFDGKTSSSIHRLSRDGDYCGTVGMPEALKVQHMQFLSHQCCFLITERRTDRLTLWGIK